MKRRFLRTVLLIILALIFLERGHVTLVRYFDSDEFSHMHWAWLLTHGEVPYRDFFFYVTPMFQWFLSPIFGLMPAGSATLLVARMWELLTFALSVYLLYRVARVLTGNTDTALLATVIYAAFPMTFDKTVDIRPDMLMILLFLVATVLIMEARAWTARRVFLIGLATGAAVLTLPKIVFALPALGYLAFTKRPKFPFSKLPALVLGGLLPPIVVSFYFLVNGVFPLAMTSLTVDAFAVNAGKVPFSPWKALSPWPLVYMAQGGPSFPWYVNTGIFVAAAAGLVWYFVKKPVYGVFYLLFFAAGILFVFSFPAPYLQYFMPLSVYAAVLAAYAVTDMPRAVARRPFPNHKEAAVAGISILLAMTALTSFTMQYRLRVSASYQNTEQLGVVRDIVKITGPDEPVYDMVGSYVFRPDGYYFCCHPYAEFIDRLPGKYPTLADSAVTRQTKFLILDRTGLSLWQPKPDDLRFLETHFIPSPYPKIYVLGAQFACFNGSCEKLNVHGRGYGQSGTAFEIVVPETYLFLITPGSSGITLSGRTIGSGDTLHLAAGTYYFDAPPSVQTVKVMLAR